jgi:hypothetical protein
MTMNAQRTSPALISGMQSRGKMSSLIFHFFITSIIFFLDVRIPALVLVAQMLNARYSCKLYYVC